MSASEIRIVRVDFENEVHCQALANLINVYRMDPMGGALPAHPDDVSQKMVDGLRKHPTSLVLLAFKDDTPVGAAVCFFGYSTFGPGPLLNIHDIIVAPSHRGQGIGKALMQEIERQALQKKCIRLTLEVREDNHIAQKLYAQCGFSAGSAPMAFWRKNIV